MYKVQRHLYCGKVLHIIETDSPEEAMDIYQEEIGIFNAYTPEDKPVKYSTVCISLLRDDEPYLESKRHFKKQRI